MESWSACEGPHPCGRRSFDLVCSQTVLPAESDCPAPPHRASRSASLPDALSSRFMLPCGPVPDEANRAPPSGDDAVCGSRLAGIGHVRLAAVWGGRPEWLTGVLLCRPGVVGSFVSRRP